MRIAILLTPAVVQAEEDESGLSKRIARIMARSDGATQETALKVASIKDEYEILSELNLTPSTQSPVVDGGKSLNLIEAIGEDDVKHMIWFDISKFLALTKGCYGCSRPSPALLALNIMRHIN